MKALWRKQRQKQLDAEKQLYLDRTAAYLEAIGGVAALAAAAPAAAAFHQAGAVHHLRELEAAPPLAPAGDNDSSEDDEPAFIGCAAFAGARAGYTFKTDASGVGYYKDEAAPAQLAEFVSSRPTTTPNPRPDLPSGVVMFNAKKWKALEINGGKVLLQMHRSDGTGGLRRRVPLTDLTADENVAVRQAVYDAKHQQRVKEEACSNSSEGDGHHGFRPLGAEPEPQLNPAVAALRAKHQAREATQAVATLDAASPLGVPFGAGAISVTFTEAGSLGLKFGQSVDTGAVVVKSINPGTQAEQHAILGPGLTLVAVGSMNVVGMLYADTIALVKKQGRPLTCQFISGHVMQKTGAMQLEPEPEPELEQKLQPSVARLELRGSSSSPNFSPDDQDNKDPEELHQVVLDILEEEGLLQYKHVLESLGIVELDILTTMGVEDFKDAGLKPGHAKRLVKVLGRSTKAMQVMAGVDVVAKDKRQAVVMEDDDQNDKNEDDPGELAFDAGIGYSADMMGTLAPAPALAPAPTSTPKFAAGTPTIQIPSRPVEPLQIRTTPRTPSDELPPPVLTPPSQADEKPKQKVVIQSAVQPQAAPVEISVALTQHPKHGFGLDVSDVLAVTSVRGEAVGKVTAPGWAIVSVEGKNVRTKMELVKALQNADAGAGATLNFVLRELSEEASIPSTVIAVKQPTRSHVPLQVLPGTGTVASVALERHPKHGYGLDLSEDLMIKSVRPPAQGKVHAGWALVAVDGHTVRTKQGLAATLQRLAVASVGSPHAWLNGHPAKVEFEFVTQAFTPAPAMAPASTGANVAPAVAECIVELRNHAKHGYGIDVSDSLVVTSVRGPALGVVMSDWTVTAVDETRVDSKKQLAAALHAVVVGASACFVFRKTNMAGPGNTNSTSSNSCLTLRRHTKHGYGLDVNDGLVVTSLRADTDASTKVGLGWRVKAVAGTSVASKRQLVSALCLASELSSSSAAHDNFSTEFLFSHTEPLQSTKPSITSISLDRDPKHGFGLDVDDSLRVVSVSRSPRKQATDDSLAAQPGSINRLVAVNGTEVRTKHELLEALVHPSTVSSAEFRFQQHAADIQPKTISTKQSGNAFDQDAEAAPASFTATRLPPLPTFETESSNVPRGGETLFIPEMASPDAVFDVSQIAPSPAPSVAPPGPSAPQLAVVDEEADTRSPGATTFLAEAEEAKSPVAVAMPAMEESDDDIYVDEV